VIAEVRLQIAEVKTDGRGWVAEYRIVDVRPLIFIKNIGIKNIGIKRLGQEI
jgi:hypothetical protein